jgi:hypothetical protein
MGVRGGGRQSPTATYTFSDFAKKDLVAAHLVDDKLGCMGGGQPAAGVEARKTHWGPLSGLAMHPYAALDGGLVGAIVAGVLVSLHYRRNRPR